MPADRLLEGCPIHVRKLRPDGSQSYAWDGVVLRCDDAGIVLRAPFNAEFVDLGFTTFRRGDEFVEFYYWDVAYNVFQISAADGTLKGWYANLGLPAQLHPGQRELTYVDLALDVWTNPDGSFIVLDEDELETMLDQRPDLTDVADQGRTELLALARAGCMPRWPA